MTRCNLSVTDRFACGCALAVLIVLSSPTIVLSQAPGDISITIEDNTSVYLGTFIDVDITLQNNSDTGIGGFDLLIDYPFEVLTFVGVSQGQLLLDCAWEYFTYRYEPYGLLRLVSIADLNNGDVHPNCYLANTSGTIAVIEFYVTNDQSYAGQSFPVQFYWMDCGDNAVADSAADELLLSRYVYDWLNHDPIHEDDDFPTYKGAPDICVTETSPRIVDYTSGRVETVDTGPSYGRGDINLNEIPYEIADLVLFQNYFLFGLSVFVIDPEQQTANTDCNADGLVLTLRDIVYLFRVIIGDADPIPRDGLEMRQDTALIVQDTSLHTVSVEYPDSLAAAWLVFDGEITPELAEGLDVGMGYESTAGFTSVLIAPWYVSGKKSFGEGLLLTYEGEGTLVQAEVADWFDTEIVTGVSYVSGYLCGDADGNLSHDIDDIVYLVEFLFSAGPPPVPLEAGDVDCSGLVDVDDIVYIVESVFLFGPPPCDPDDDGIPDC